MKTIYPTLLLTALIILSSHSVSAGLPKAVEIERQKRLMMEALSSDNCESAMKNLTKLEALQAQLPQDLTYYVKGKCYYKQGEYMRALQSLEAFFNQVESDHINYNKALDLYSVIENAEEERKKAEIDRRKAEIERKKVEEERRKAEEKRKAIERVIEEKRREEDARNRKVIENLTNEIGFLKRCKSFYYNTKSDLKDVLEWYSYINT